MSSIVQTKQFGTSTVDASENSRRGTAEYVLHAVDFASNYPLGSYNQPTTIKVEDFDAWLEERGILVVPPEGTPRNSDAWLGHLQRRHHAAKKMNLASTTTKVEKHNVKPFVIKIGGGIVTVRAPHEQIAQGEVPKKVQSVLMTRRKQLRYLMESSDWAVLPPHERMLAEALNDDIDLFEYNIAGHIQHLSMKFDKLAHKIHSAVANNEIVSTNGGIKRFLADPADMEKEDVHFERMWENQND